MMCVFFLSVLYLGAFVGICTAAEVGGLDAE